MGTKTKTTSTQQGTQTVAPPSWTMPGISDAAGRVTAAISSLPGQKYTGNFNALPNMELTNGAIDAYKGAAGQATAGAGQIEQAITGLNGVAPVTTGTFAPGAGYDLTGAIGAATAPLFRQLTEGTLPGLRSSAIDSGAYSGDRAMSVLPSAAIQSTAENAQNLGAQFAYQDYQANEARRLAAYQTDQSNALQAGTFNNTFALNRAQMLPDLLMQQMQLASGAGDLLAGAAGTQQQAEQAIINNDLAKNQYEWQYPFQGLDIASALLSQLSGGYGTTTSNSTGTQTQSTGGAGAIASGLLGAASLAASLPTGGAGATLGSSLMSKLFKKGA